MNNKASKSSRTNSGSSNGSSAETDNVDKIRDILFGNQMRDVEKRFASMEKTLSNDLAAMRKENALQIESLKNFIENELEILGSKLMGEEKSRIENVDELDSKVKQHVKQFDKKVTDVAKSLDKSARDLNKKLLQQSQEYSKELNSQIGEARERMDDHRQELSNSKVDKQLLAEMLNSLALQINSDESG